VHHPGEAGRGEQERQLAAAAEHLDAEVDGRHVAEHVRVELHAGVGLAGAPQAQLPLGGAVGVVEHRPRCPPLGNLPQIPDGVRFGKAAFDRGQRQPAGLEQLAQLRWAGQSSGGHGAPSAAWFVPTFRP
jgi:hypothetical protein